MKKKSKGHNSVNNVDGVTVLVSAHCLIMLYISIKFHENTSKSFRFIERTRNHDGNFQVDIIP